MMTMIYKNDHGVEFDLTNNALSYLVDVTGQTTAKANLSSVTTGGVDGDRVNNAQVVPRTLVLTLRVKSGVNVELAKRELCRVVKIKKEGTLVWTQEDRTLTISGVVESIDEPRWTNAVALQISLHCSYPYWTDIDDQEQEISEVIDLHYFTEYPDDQLFFMEEGQAFGIYDFSRSRSFENLGDADVGMLIEIRAYETVTNPELVNEDGQFFGLGWAEKPFVMNSGDVVRINTGRDQKSAILNGMTNLLGFLKPKSVWLQMAAGVNTFAIRSDDASTQNMSFSIVFTPAYI